MKNNNKTFRSNFSVDHKNGGFTLIELMVTISVAVILASIGMPGLTSTIQNNKLVSLHNDLSHAFFLARNLAISRGSWATLCNSNNSGNQCAEPEEGWDDGWIIFEDINNDGRVNSGEDILLINKEMTSDNSIFSSRKRISFNAQGFAIGYTGTFTFCDVRGNNSRKGLVISNSGRVRVATESDNMANCGN